MGYCTYLKMAVRLWSDRSLDNQQCKKKIITIDILCVCVCVCVQECRMMGKKNATNIRIFHLSPHLLVSTTSPKTNKLNENK